VDTELLRQKKVISLKEDMAMEKKTLTLAPFYKGWDVYQEQLVKAIGPLTQEQLELRSAPHMWSVGMLTRHIIAARASWFHGRMGVGGEEMVELNEWDEEAQERHSASELVAGLEATWAMIETALESWTPEDLDREFPHPTRQDRPPRSRQWIIWHVFEHDMHHGGELSLTLGMYGVPALDL
jgi:uncharacterized damage-inducible protein DinB